MNKSSYPSIKNPFLYSKKIQDDEIYVIYEDIHGCLDELKSSMSWISNTIDSQQNKQITYIFLGDIVDRGPYSYEALEYIFSRQDTKVIIGNHEKKILRRIEENNYDEGEKWFLNLTSKQKNNIWEWYKKIPTVINLKTDNKDFYLAHGAFDNNIKIPYHEEEKIFNLSSAQRDICIYGHTNGLKDSNGFPIRLHEPCGHKDQINVFGHITHNSLEVNDWIKLNEPGITIQLDHGAVHGGHLTAMIIRKKVIYFVSDQCPEYFESKSNKYNIKTEMKRIINVPELF